jgi:DNA-binding response OmpR family regulator
MVGGTDFLKAAKAIGATDTLAKPFRALELVEKVNALLAGADTPRHAGAPHDAQTGCCPA